MARTVRKTLYYLFLIWIFSVVNLVHGQQYTFRHLTAGDGLPVSYCHQVLQDSLGFIWIATRTGICRYDGYELKVYQYDPLDSSSISDNRTGESDCMILDNQGCLWVGTVNGLNRFDPVTGKFKRYFHKPDDPASLSSNTAYSLCKDRKGTIWIGTPIHKGLNKYLPETDEFKIYQYNPGDSTFVMPAVLNILEDSRGNFWLATARGIYQFDRENECFIGFPLTDIPDLRNKDLIRKVFEDTDGTIYFGTPYGFLKYDSVTHEIHPFKPLFWEDDYMRYIDIIADPEYPDRFLWVMKFPALFLYDKSTNTHREIFTYPIDKSGVLSAPISSYCDKSKNLWLPGVFGVSILNPGQLRSYYLPGFQIDYQFPNCFLEDHNGHLWIGTENEYLLHYDQEMDLIKSYDGLTLNNHGEEFTGGFQYLYEDSGGNIWIGTRLNGLFLLEKGSEEPIQCQLPVRTNVWVHAILEDSEGNMWVGADEGLFYHRKGQGSLTRFSQDSTWPGLQKAAILCVFEDSYEDIWIGTAFDTFGMYRQPKALRGSSTFLKYSYEPANNESLSNNIVWSITEDADNNLWIGTENGLNRFLREEERFERHLNDEDPGTNYIYDVISDGNGHLWLGTESGIVRYDPGLTERKIRSAKKYKQVILHRDALFYSMYKNKSGELLVGSSHNDGKGYYRFHPDGIYENRPPPPIVITGFHVRNDALLTDTCWQFKKTVLLDHDQNFFEIEFAALDFFDPQKNEYTYILEGFDEHWIYGRNQHKANYTGVPPGEYIFRVKGSNSDGYWNEKEAAIAITILPPFWNTGWAYLLYALFILGIIVSIIWYYLKRQQLRQALIIEQMQKEKLEEMDSLKSRFFANISHEFRTPLTLMLGIADKLRRKIHDQEGRDDLNVLQRNANRLKRLIDQLLNLSRIEAGQMKLKALEENLVPLVRGYLQFFESAARQKDIELSFVSEKDDIFCYVDREKLEQILYNLISNALKFTQAGGRVAVKVSSQMKNSDIKNTADCRLLTADLPENSIVISITDTGSGIAPAHLPHIFDRFYQADDGDTRFQEGSGIGLALAKELVELHHGKIMVESEVGKGTTFFVLLLQGRDHLREEEMDTSRQSSVVSQPPPHPLFETSPPVPLSNMERGKRGQGVEGGEVPLLLIVEDNPDMRYYLQDILHGYYQLMEAVNGNIGVEMARKKIPDLVISDVMMPKMDGYELCRVLKTDERTSHIPVILLTAKAAMEDKLEGLETGADDFITKPFQPQELLVRVKNLIDQRQQLRKKYRREFEQLSLVPDESMSSMDARFMDRVRKVLEENQSDSDFDVDEFSHRMNLSRSQLHRKLTALFGLSASTFIRNYRLNTAARLLKARAGNVAEIAFEVGFNNLSYFSRCFRQQFGVRPSEYH